MRETVIKVDMDKDSLREGLIQLIEYITKNPPESDEFGSKERINYNLGVYTLFVCLRQTYK